MWRDVLAAGDSQLLVARAGPQVLGFASFGSSRDADAPVRRRLLAQGHSSVFESLAGIPRFIPLDAGLATAGQPSEGRRFIDEACSRWLGDWTCCGC